MFSSLLKVTAQQEKAGCWLRTAGNKDGVARNSLVSRTVACIMKASWQETGCTSQGLGGMDLAITLQLRVLQSQAHCSSELSIPVMMAFAIITMCLEWMRASKGVRAAQSAKKDPLAGMLLVRRVLNNIQEGWEKIKTGTGRKTPKKEWT